MALGFGKREAGFVTLLHLPPSIFSYRVGVGSFCPVVAVCFFLCTMSYLHTDWQEAAVAEGGRKERLLNNGARSGNDG